MRRNESSLDSFVYSLIRLFLLISSRRARGDNVPIEELTGELVCAASRSLLRGTGGAKASLNRAN